MKFKQRLENCNRQIEHAENTSGGQVLVHYMKESKVKMIEEEICRKTKQIHELRKELNPNIDKPKCTNCGNGSLEESIKCPICESDIFSPQCLRHREIILKNFKSDL